MSSEVDMVKVTIQVGILVLAMATALIAWSIWLRLGSKGHLPFISFFITLGVMTLGIYPFVLYFTTAIDFAIGLHEVLEVLAAVFLLMAAWRLHSIASPREED